MTPRQDLLVRSHQLFRLKDGTAVGGELLHRLLFNTMMRSDIHWRQALRNFRTARVLISGDPPTLAPASSQRQQKLVRGNYRTQALREVSISDSGIAMPHGKLANRLDGK